MVLPLTMQHTTPVLAVPKDRFQMIPTAQDVVRRAQTEQLFVQLRTNHRVPPLAPRRTGIRR